MLIQDSYMMHLGWPISISIKQRRKQDGGGMTEVNLEKETAEGTHYLGA